MSIINSFFILITLVMLLFCCLVLTLDGLVPLVSLGSRFLRLALYCSHVSVKRICFTNLTHAVT